MMAGNGNEKQCESFRESVASMASGNGKGKGKGKDRGMFPGARHFIIIRESPGVIVMVFCSCR